MKVLNITADVSDIGFDRKGEIKCEVLVTYKLHNTTKRKTAYFNFNVSDLIELWER